VDRAAAKLEQQIEKAKTKVMRRRNAAAVRRSEDRRTAATNGTNGTTATNGTNGTDGPSPRPLRRAV
jgi:hypothetical protein